MQSHRDRAVGGPLSDPRRVERAAAHEREPASGDREGVDRGQSAHCSVGRTGGDDGGAVGRGRERGRERRVRAVEVVPELAGAEDATRAVLKLQHREAAHLHRDLCPVEQPAAFARVLVGDGNAEAVVAGEFRGERPQSVAVGRERLREFGVDGGGDGVDPTRRFLVEARGHLAAHAVAEDEQGRERHGRERDGEPCAEGHRDDRLVYQSDPVRVT